jgi:hypothetical protein
MTTIPLNALVHTGTSASLPKAFLLKGGKFLIADLSLQANNHALYLSVIPREESWEQLGLVNEEARAHD